MVENKSERWIISVEKADMMLKGATRLIDSAILPLARRYQIDNMFETNMIRGSIVSDIICIRVVSSFDVMNIVQYLETRISL